MKSLFSVVIFFFLFGSNSSAVDIWQDHAKPAFKNGFDTTGLFVIAGGGLAVGLTQPYDYQVRDAYSDHQRISDSASRIGDMFGTGAVGALIVFTQSFADPDGAWAHGTSLVATFLTTSLLKQTNHRTRPANQNHQSMPSGHTSTAFATATSLAYSYGWKAAVPAYTLATFVAMTRWSDNAHWLSDTVAGAFVGFFWGRATRRLPDETVAQSLLTPVIQTNFVGLNWTSVF